VNPIPPKASFAAISADSDQFCGIETDGAIACWSIGSSVQMAPPSGSFTQIAAGYDQACALATDGNVRCWGDTSIQAAIRPPAGPFIQIAAACGLRPNGYVTCWGSYVIPDP
jgi:hypothetical protein